MYYLIAYAVMSIGAFAVVAASERELAKPVTLEGMAGLGWERPGLGAAMTLFMFGFIGLPPAALFIGKFYVFSAAVDRGWAWLAIVGAVATAVSVYYYLGVVRAMYFQPAADTGLRPQAARPRASSPSEPPSSSASSSRSAPSSRPSRSSTSPKTLSPS